MSYEELMDFLAKIIPAIGEVGKDAITIERNQFNQYVVTLGKSPSYEEGFAAGKDTYKKTVIKMLEKRDEGMGFVMRLHPDYPNLTETFIARVDSAKREINNLKDELIGGLR